MTNAAVIQVQDISKIYRDGLLFRRSLKALENVSLRVDNGEIFGLLGPNGAGKTTLVKLLLGIVRKTSGDAELLGRPVGTRHSRKDVGYLPENLRVPRHHTALTALSYFGQLSGMSRNEVRRRRDYLLELVGLQDRARDSVKKYSKGMLQRLGLAIALVHDPKVIFMDEPTDGLDPTGRAKVRQLLQRLKGEGKCIFLNSHLLQEVELVCDRVAILDRGRLRGIGTVDQLVAHQADGMRVDIVMRGAEDAIRGLLPEPGKLSLQAAAGGNWQLMLPAKDQQEIDQFVDQLRARNVSVVSLVPQRLSLEEAFLSLMGTEAERS